MPAPASASPSSRSAPPLEPPRRRRQRQAELRAGLVELVPYLRARALRFAATRPRPRTSCRTPSSGPCASAPVRARHQPARVGPPGPLQRLRHPLAPPPPRAQGAEQLASDPCAWTVPASFGAPDRGRRGHDALDAAHPGRSARRVSRRDRHGRPRAAHVPRRRGRARRSRRDRDEPPASGRKLLADKLSQEAA